MEKQIFFISNYKIFNGKILKRSKKGAFWVEISKDNKKLVSPSNVFETKEEVEKELNKRINRKKQASKKNEKEIEELKELHKKILTEFEIEIPLLSLPPLDELKKYYNRLKKEKKK